MATITPWAISHGNMRSFANFINGFEHRYIENQADYTLAYKEQLLERLENNWLGYARLHMELTNRMNAANPDALNLDAAFEEELEVTASVYEGAKQSWLNVINMSIAEEPAPYVPPPLPKPNEISLPQFSGDYREYTAFRSAVLARVYHAAYPVHTKIDIIVKALSGDAKTQIGAVRGQDEDELMRIWECLEETFYNRYLLQRSHMGAIYEQPEIRSESATAYRAMINRINQNLHALEQLDIPTRELDPAILEMVLRKLDVDGTKHWETTRPKDRLPTIQSFTRFLEDRIVVIMNTSIQAVRTVPKAEHSENGSHSRGDSRSQARGGKQSHADLKRSHEQQGGGDAKRQRHNDEARNELDERPRQPTECVMDCHFNKPHWLWLCRKFQALTLEKRNQVISQHKLCRRCITLKHPIDQCNYRRCGDCNDDVHNRALCPKMMVIAKANTVRPSGGARRQSKRAGNPFVKNK